MLIEIFDKNFPLNPAQTHGDTIRIGSKILTGVRCPLDALQDAVDRAAAHRGEKVDGQRQGGDGQTDIAEGVLQHVGRQLERHRVPWLSQPGLGCCSYLATHVVTQLQETHRQTVRVVAGREDKKCIVF